MDPHYLSRDELQYELYIRNFDNTDAITMSAMQRKLNSLLQKEKFGIHLPHPNEELDFSEELKICRSKLDSLTSLLESFDGLRDSVDYTIIVTKLAHLLGRLTRVVSDAAEINQIKDKYISELTGIEDSVEEVCRLCLGKNSGQDKKHEITTQDSTEGSIRISRKQIPVCQWNLTFSGDGKGLNVIDFLERVGELKLARNVSDYELFDSCCDLFSGDALVWYHSVKNKVADWHDLVQELRANFLSADYERELLHHVRNKKQKVKEPVTIYIASMQNLFNRLSKHLPESEKLYILKCNLLPDFIHDLGVSDSENKISTVDELLHRCKSLEQTYRLANRNRSQGSTPSTSSDFRANPSSSSGRSNVGSVGLYEVHPHSPSNNKLICWNCSQKNHTYKSCNFPLRKFCFSCGAPNKTKLTCRKCNPGNSRTSHTRVGQ